MAEEMKGPGMLWVTSRIAKSSADILDETTFLKWYDDDHIAEIVATSGIKSAFRYINVEKESHLGSSRAPKPFLAFYPMEDLVFTQGEEFKAIRVKSDMLPSTGIVYDMAEFDIGYMGLVGRSGQKQEGGPAPYILVSAIEPAPGTAEADINSFYNRQTSTLSKATNYIRTLRLKLVYARTNSESRALKGLPTTDETATEPPTWQAVHEFASEPSLDVRQSITADSSELLNKAKQNEVTIYKFVTAQGDQKCFE